VEDSHGISIALPQVSPQAGILPVHFPDPPIRGKR
jgi:hypothetical protein